MPSIYCKWVAFSLVFCVGLLSKSASAQVFDNGNPIYSVLPMDAKSDDNVPIHFADDFRLSSTANSFSRIMWFGYHGVRTLSDPMPTRKFNIEIYEAGPIVLVPNPIPIHTFLNQTPTESYVLSGGSPKLNFGAFPIMRYDLQIPTLTLVPDRTYFICIYAVEDTTVPPGQDWGWAHTNHTGDTAFRSPSYSPYFFYTGAFLTTHGDFSFKLF